MFQRVFLTAVIAGLCAGLVVFAAQRVKIYPLIELAEVYEAQAATAHAHDHAHEHGAAAEAEWEPAPGFERGAYSLVADIVAGVGFALLLVGAVALANLRGHAIDLRRGVMWGAAGFVVFTLAPSLGLAPELPGMAAADLVVRQEWWIGTVLATACGLGLIVFWRSWPYRIAGVVALVAPHLIGAPLDTEAGSVPPELAAQFVVASMATAALFWLVLGGLSGWLYRYLGGPEEAAGR
jgi:cobalt transporter subunit CbtA